MKHIIRLFSIILVLSCTIAVPLGAYSLPDLAKLNATLAPLAGAYGVNVGSRYFETDIDEDGWVDTDADDDFDYEIKPGDVPGGWSGHYSDWNIVMMGGVYGIPSDVAADGFFIEVNITTDTDFEFVSISNPSYRRPYTLTLVSKAQGSDGAVSIGVQKIDGNMNNKRIYFPSSIPPSYNDNMMWFDMVLGLPYDEITSSGLLTVPGGEQYVLGRVDDYASFVTVELRWGTNQGYGGSKVVSIPFSGYYRADESNFNDSTSSLQVDANAKSAALDIRNDSNREVEIATLRYAQTYVQGPQHLDELKGLRLFLSASPDPFYRDSEGFRLLHVDYQPGEAITDYNSVPFRMIARPVSNSGAEVSFDGRDYVESSSNRILYNSIKPELNTDSDFGHSTGIKNPYFATYEGTLSIYMDYGGYMMKSGMYEETVYVHVISGVSS